MPVKRTAGRETPPPSCLTSRRTHPVRRAPLPAGKATPARRPGRSPPSAHDQNQRAGETNANSRPPGRHQPLLRSRLPCSAPARRLRAEGARRAEFTPRLTSHAPPASRRRREFASVDDDLNGPASVRRGHCPEFLRERARADNTRPRPQDPGAASASTPTTSTSAFIAEDDPRWSRGSARPGRHLAERATSASSWTPTATRPGPTNSSSIPLGVQGTCA